MLKRTPIEIALLSTHNLCFGWDLRKINFNYSKTSQKDQKLVFKTIYCLMQVKSIAECSKGSILQYFWPFVINIFVLSIFEWPFFCFCFFSPGRVEHSLTCLVTDACLTAEADVPSLILAWSHTFVDFDHEIISTVILLPSADSFKKGCHQLQEKVC